MDFNEEFLHFVWRFKLYGAPPFETTTGLSLSIIKPGLLNNNAGPDFSNAKLIIDGTTWVGNIEVHLKSSHWFVHQHHIDSSYENVVLHVVYEEDVPVYRNDGSLLPAFVIKNRFPIAMFHNFEQLNLGIYNFPCERLIHNVDEFVIQNALTSILIERLMQRTAEIQEKLDLVKGDWDAVLYLFLARSFGFKVNALPMEILLRSIPLQLFAKHADNTLQIEALLFGQAGFLNARFDDAYPNALKREYLFLKRKYGLTPIDVSLWKFLRMRPQNFPTLRLAQFAALIHKTRHLFSTVMHAKEERGLMFVFENLPVHAFWQSHYHFNRKATQVNVQMGKSSIQNILCNTVVRVLFAYGKLTDQNHLIRRALSLLEHLPGEKNAIITQFEKAGVTVENAFHSQALLQLKKGYCNEKKCLQCRIGVALVKGIQNNQKNLEG